MALDHDHTNPETWWNTPINKAGLAHDHTSPTVWETPSNKPKLAGSVFVNNTSYSGCDIKVLLKMHPNKSFFDLDVSSQLSKNILRDESDKKRTDSEVSRVYAKLALAKTGTLEFQRLSAQLTKLTKTLNDLNSSIKSSYKAAEEKAKTQTSQKGMSPTKVLAEVQTLSFSCFRDKQAVRRCGTVYPAGFTRGPREMAGSLIFTVFDKHVLYEFLDADPSDFDGVKYTSAVMDQIPPVDILISFANEYGSVSRMDIYGVEFLTEGQVMSIEDMLLEHTVSFVARDWDPMRAVSKRKIDEVSSQLQKQFAKTGSDLIYEEDFKKVKDATNPFTRFSSRRNPFL